MSVGYVQCRDLLEQIFDASDQFIVIDDPQSMADACRIGEIIFRIMSIHESLYDGPDPLVIFISQEYRLCVRIAGIKVVDSVLFFLYSCELMFFDGIVHVFIYADASNYAGLIASVHLLPVDIKSRLFLFNKYTFVQELIDVFLSLLVNGRTVRVLLFRKIYFRSAYMKEAVRIALRHLCCLFSVHNIIRQRLNLLRILFCRPDGLEWSYCRHFNSPYLKL